MSDLATLDLDFLTGTYRVIPYVETQNFPSLLPPSSTALERIIEQSGAAAIANIPAVITSIWNADTCPSPLLPYLAWALSIDEWDNKWSDDKKRQIIKESREIHARKGTIGAVKRALASIGQADASVLERGDYVLRNGTKLRNGIHTRRGAGGWATYRVILRQAVTIDQAKQIKRLLAAAQRNCIVLTAVDFRKSTFSRNGTLRRNGAYTRGVVNTTLY